MEKSMTNNNSKKEVKNLTDDDVFPNSKQLLKFEESFNVPDYDMFKITKNEDNYDANMFADSDGGENLKLEERFSMKSIFLRYIID